VNEAVQNFLSGKSNSLPRSGGSPVRFNRAALPPSLGEPPQTVTERYMGHLPSKEQLFGDVPALSYNKIRTVNL
jgi:hypothetical protein